jgi:hypothetical protein
VNIDVPEEANSYSLHTPLTFEEGQYEDIVAEQWGLIARDSISQSVLFDLHGSDGVRCFFLWFECISIEEIQLSQDMGDAGMEARRTAESANRGVYIPDEPECSDLLAPLSD